MAKEVGSPTHISATGGWIGSKRFAQGRTKRGHLSPTKKRGPQPFPTSDYSTLLCCSSRGAGPNFLSGTRSGIAWLREQWEHIQVVVNKTTNENMVIFIVGRILDIHLFVSPNGYYTSERFLDSQISGLPCKAFLRLLR